MRSGTPVTPLHAYVDFVQVVKSTQSTTIVHLGAVRLVHQDSSATKCESLSCVVLTSSDSEVNCFVLSLLPELGTMGSKWGELG